MLAMCGLTGRGLREERGDCVAACACVDGSQGVGCVGLGSCPWLWVKDMGTGAMCGAVQEMTVGATWGVVTQGRSTSGQDPGLRRTCCTCTTPGPSVRMRCLLQCAMWERG